MSSPLKFSSVFASFEKGGGGEADGGICSFNGVEKLIWLILCAGFLPYLPSPAEKVSPLVTDEEDTNAQTKRKGNPLPTTVR